MKLTLKKNKRNKSNKYYNFNKMTEYATIKLEELIFFDEDKSNLRPWEAFPESPIRGIVGCFGADRAQNWDLFVVIDYDEETHIIKCIHPRIRFNKSNNTIELGPDRMTEEYEYKTTCKCESPSQGGDLGCHCSAYKNINKDYAKTFIKQKDINYIVSSFVHLKHTDSSFIFYEHVTVNMLEDLDMPNTRKSAKCCRQYS